MKAALVHKTFITLRRSMRRRMPRTRRTRAYGGALRAYDKNRLHPIPATFALRQYCAVNLAEAGDVRK